MLLLPLSWRERAQACGHLRALVVAMAAPYLWFIQRNGGVRSYFEQASAWAERDRDRAPVVWPGLFDNPEACPTPPGPRRGVSKAVEVVRDNMTAWIYYVESLALPFFALFVLWTSSDGGRPGWPHAKAKLATVAMLAVMLNADFLRSPLDARLADPAVPHAILLGLAGGGGAPDAASAAPACGGRAVVGSAPAFGR